jgi:hypothetical protein
VVFKPLQVKSRGVNLTCPAIALSLEKGGGGCGLALRKNCSFPNWKLLSAILLKLLFYEPRSTIFEIGSNLIFLPET